MLMLIAVMAASFAFTYAAVPWFIPRLMRAGISGKDMNKKGKPVVAEMGGLVILGGFVVGVLVATGMITFGLESSEINMTVLFASLSTILVMGIIGAIDDLLNIQQHIKAMLPLFAALPLIAISAGISHMYIPILGDVEFGFIYPFLLVPLAITGASNATNMLAGFNGLEAGLGSIMCLTMGLSAFYSGSMEAAIISVAMFGALTAFLKYNWYPSKIFIGDVGTLIIGATVATSAIVGNIERAGIILIIPFFAELYLKMRGKLKEQSWCMIKKGKLICNNRSEIYGLGRLMMYLNGGISERNLTLSLMAMELIFAITAVGFTILRPI